MRLSIFSVVDHHPAGGRSLGRRYEQVIRHCELADRLGFACFFIAEHHFHEYGAVPDPAVLLPVLALRTERIRLGPAVAVLPFRDPIALAESYAMVDLIAGGRLVLGVGSGYLKHEFEGFGIDPAEKRERFDESLMLVMRLLAGERVTHAGRFHRLNGVALNVLPPQPPPVYVAILRKEAAYHVGRKGQQIMSIPYATLDRLAEIEGVIQEFRRGRADAGLEPGEDDAIFAFHAHVARTDASARAEAAEAFELYVATRLYARRQTYDDILVSGLALFGSVETVADKLLRLHAFGIRHIALLPDFGLMPPELVERSLRLIASEVVPRIEARIGGRTLA